MVEFKDVVCALQESLDRREAVALASIVQIRGSSPRHNGSRMLVWPDGRIVGTIGGGTMEYCVIEDAAKALMEGESRLENYVFDASGRPGSVGLCGGSVDVHIDVRLEEFNQVGSAALDAINLGEFVALASVIREGELVSRREHRIMLIKSNGETFGSLGNKTLEKQVMADAVVALECGKTDIFHYQVKNGKAEPETAVVHLNILKPDPTLLIIGAGHVAKPLAAMGKMLGMRVYVVDNRAEWANRERFPTADEIAVIDYEPVNEILAPIPFPMTPATHVVVTTWGYDLPAMEQALEQAPAYIGLVASPTKARVLFKRLQNSGFPNEAIQRIKAPVGLDIGAESPTELALSILAEILTEKHGKTGRPLEQIRGAHIKSLFSRSIPVASP